MGKNIVMKKIGIDVDGVLRDFCDGLTKVVREHYPQYMKDDFVEVNDWKLANNFNCTKEDLQQIYWHDYADEIMGNSNPIQGAIEQMYDLMDWAEEKGHSLVCVTSQKLHARHHTLSWLGKYGLNFDTVYFRKGWQKWMVDVDYLVDDSPNNFENWVRGRGMQEGFILMNQPYNEHIKSNCRIKELKQIKEIING
jgi:5'(3')-deoxyribonucleotidase